MVCDISCYSFHIGLFHCSVFFSLYLNIYVDSSSTASSSTNYDPVKTSTPINGRTIKKHSNGLANHYKSLNIVAHHQQPSTSISNDNNHHSLIDQQPTTSPSNHRSHPPVSGNLLPKTVSNSIADLSLSSHHQKMSPTTVRLPTFQSKLDNCNTESYKKIPLSQSFDWGMLAITNTDLILLYNKDKSSLVIFDANGHENEVNRLFFYSSNSNLIF